jgi:hypothetical protein
MRSVRENITMELTYQFTNKEITPWGGMVFLKQFLDKMAFSEQVAACDFLPQPGSNRGYAPSELLEAFVCSVWCGATKFIHTELTRSDKALSNIFEWERVPAQDAYKRFFSKFSSTDNLRVADYFFRWLIENYQYDNFTIDFDSSVLTRYGTQEGSKRGYNPQKRGRCSHHPLIAFINDLRLVTNFWLRSGDTSSSSNFLAFLENTLEKLENKKVSLVRLDSGFCSDSIMTYLEGKEKPLPYIIAAKLYKPIQHLIAGSENWIFIDNGIEICEKQYQAKDWKTTRRIIIVRQKISVRPQATGKTLSLFPQEETYRNYRYSAYFTNLDFAPAEVWRLYCPRGDAENRIKEMKYDFGFDSFNLKGFYATEAVLIFVMIAYNLMSVFRMFVLQEKTQKRLSTLRWRTFAIGAYFQKVNGNTVLMIALTKKRRRWFDDLWNYPLKLPLFSNA